MLNQKENDSLITEYFDSASSYILWLPSWYPNEKQPTNGDFIQRHAEAASLYNKIKVLFFTQFGEDVSCEFKIKKKTHETLDEYIIYIPFKPSGIKWVDKIRYNIQFYSFSRKFISKYFKEHGAPGLVHVHVPVKSGNIAYWIKKKYKISYLVSEHASTYLNEAPDSYFKRSFFYKKQVKRIFENAIAVTNVSATIGNILLELFNIKNLLVIPNVVNESLFKPKIKEAHEFTFIHASTLTEQKNIFGILRSFAELYKIRQDWKLVILGAYTTDIVNFITAQHLSENITLMNEVPHDQVPMYMQQSDVFVLFSNHENLPCVILEALCVGIPVISSIVGGVEEAVNRENGILVEKENEKELLEALLKIREEYHSYDRNKISREATEKYKGETIGKQFNNLYKQLLAKSKKQ
jgi:glycosyltransferase involved in cell wall biosynthesis